MGFRSLKRWRVAVVAVLGILIAVPMSVFAAPYPDPLIQDSEYVVTNDGKINYRLAQFAAKLATQVYTDKGAADFAPEENPYAMNNLYAVNLQKQTESLRINGFSRENIWLVNHFNDPDVLIKRLQDVSTNTSKIAILAAAALDRTSPIDELKMQITAKASVQGIIAKKPIVFQGVRRNLWIVVFRGTEGFAPDGIIDWEMNVAASEIPFNPTPDNIRVHRGFFSSLRAFEIANVGMTSISVEEKNKV